MTECKDICPTEWKLYGGQALPKQTILTFFSFSKEMVSYIFFQVTATHEKNVEKCNGIVLLYLLPK